MREAPINGVACSASRQHGIQVRLAEGGHMARGHVTKPRRDPRLIRRHKTLTATAATKCSIGGSPIASGLSSSESSYLQHGLISWKRGSQVYRRCRDRNSRAPKRESQRNADCLHAADRSRKGAVDQTLPFCASIAAGGVGRRVNVSREVDARAFFFSRSGRDTNRSVTGGGQVESGFHKCRS